MIKISFPNSVEQVITLCYYQGGMITIHDEKGTAVKVTNKELYKMFKDYLDKNKE